MVTLFDKIWGWKSVQFIFKTNTTLKIGLSLYAVLYCNNCAKEQYSF